MHDLTKPCDYERVERTHKALAIVVYKMIS